MSLEQNKAVVCHFVEEIQCQHNLAKLDEFFSPDFVDHGGMTDPPNREGARAFLGAFLAAMPDSHFTIHQQLAEGDKVMTYKTCQATHLGPFGPFPATGKPVTFDVVDIFTVADGQLTDHWLVTDLLGVMLQIGASAA
ncbi:MAG TPA: ester cyclase [Anaerolineae bacterium]|nr:ester cyclase [Anaerolineae bacterium]